MFNLSNIYILAGLTAVVGTVLAYVYLRIAKQDDESTGTYYVKKFTFFFLTALGALWIQGKLGTKTLSGGGNPNMLSSGTNTSAEMMTDAFTMEKISTGLPTF